MKFTAKFTTGIFVYTALVLATLPSYAAPSGIPPAKQAEKVKVVDSKNKRLGFIGATNYLTFKADGRFFQVLVSKEELKAPYTRLLFESSDCSGLPYLQNDNDEAILIHEDAFLKPESDGYLIYMYDLSTPFDSNVSVSVNSAMYSDGFCDIARMTTSVRRAKVVAKLPFTPPFTLK